MYVIYYNCYFYRYLKGYVPKWVITDLLAHRKYTNTLRDTNTNKSFNKTATSKGNTFSSAKNTSITPFKVTIGGDMNNLA